MSTRQRATLPRALPTARRQFDQWRSRQRKRARLPEELWRRAVALAREHGLNKTSRTLGLKYYSLKKHLDQAGAGGLVPAKAKPDFIELLPSVMSSGSIECTIEWADSSGTTVRMHIKGAGLLNRKGAYCCKTVNGAHVGDLFMSLIHTCELNKVIPASRVLSKNATA